MIDFGLPHAERFNGDKPANRRGRDEGHEGEDGHPMIEENAVKHGSRERLNLALGGG